MMTYQLLHLEDNPNDAELVRACLDASAIQCNVVLAMNQRDYLQAINEKPPDLVISDFRLRGFDGIQAFQLLQERNPNVPFILLSGALGESRAVECLRIGMTDFILKHHLERLAPLVERALREVQERRERITAQAALVERHQEIEDLNKRLQGAIWESQHRIKNNLQILNGLVDAMRADKIPGSPQSLERLASHIRGLATLHDVFTYQTNTPGASLDRLSARLALERLIPAMASILAPRTLTLDAEDVELTVKQVTSLSLVVNELVSNAIKHGEGAIAISLKQDNVSLVLDVCNDGLGFPPSFDLQKSANTGLELIESIGTFDLGGTLSYENTATGARVRLRFPCAL